MRVSINLAVVGGAGAPQDPPLDPPVVVDKIFILQLWIFSPTSSCPRLLVVKKTLVLEKEKVGMKTRM